MSDHTLHVSNKRIYDFYQNNPSLNFEAMNLLLLDFMEQMNQDLTKTLQNTIQNEILQTVHTLESNVDSLNKRVDSQNNSIVLKFHEINKDFLESMKLVIDNAMNTNTDKLNVNLDKTTEVFVAKLMTIIPQNNETIQKDFQSVMKTSQDQICELVKTQNPSKVEEYLKTFDHRLKSAQEPLLQYIKMNHEQIQTQCDNLRDSATVSQTTQDKVYTELNEFLNKFKSSSSLKGQYSENMLEGVLNKLYPMASVLNTSSNRAMGDFILRRNGMSNVLIENKNYEANICNEEVKKFLRDIKEQNCNGLFLSQYSGIVNKPNYFIEIHEGNVLVYIHHVGYDMEKIKTGIEIIDHLSDKIKDFYVNENKGFTIDKDVLDGINSEFQTFLTHRDSLVLTVRDFQKKFTTQIEELRMPELQMYLCGKYANAQTNQYLCVECGETFAKKNSLASHMKKHKMKS